MPRLRDAASTTLLILASLFVLVGCAVNPKPRYVSDRTKRSNSQETYGVGKTVSDSVRFVDRLETAQDGEAQAALQLLDDEAQHAKLAATINTYLAARYKYGAESTDEIDCSGFVKAVFQETFAIALPRKAAEMFRLGAPVAKNGLETGDLVFFSTARKRSINHVGIYLSEKKFVHASTSLGVTISSLDEAYWKRCYVGARRI